MSDGSALAVTGTVRSPHYRPLLRVVDVVGHALLGGGRRRPIRFAELRRKAERTAGYDDWGMTPDFERAAELLEKDLTDHPARFFGRLATADTLLAHHVRRLRLRQALAARPPSSGFARPPYIITGLFRTGTTLMHNLMSAPPDRDFPRTYELLCPTPTPKREAEARSMTRISAFLTPELSSIHPFLWDGPEECWPLTATSLRTADFGVIQEVPSYNRWLADCDMLEPYLEYRAAVEYLASFREQTLVMKGPAHTPYIEALHRAIPEARIVFMHRDPAKAVASYSSLSAIHHRTFYGSYDPKAVGEKVLERFASFIEAAMEQRPRVPDESILDVDYHDLVADPVAAIRRVSEHFGDPFGDEHAAAVQAKLDDLPRHKFGKHVYSAEQWGLSADSIRDRFGSYLREREVRLDV